MMDPRAKAYRLFIITRAWYAHLHGLALSSVACAVGIARNPGTMSLPFLPQLGASGWWLEPRWYFVATCPCLFSCAVFSPGFYVDRYERFCDLITVLGLLTRHGAMFDGTDVRRDTATLLSLLRPAFLLASVLSLRYELSKQWKMHAVRVGLDVPMNVYRKLRFGDAVGDAVGGSVAPTRALIAVVAGELVRNLALLALTLGAHWAVERRDRAAFEEKVRLMRRMADATDADAPGRREGRARRGVVRGRVF